MSKVLFAVSGSIAAFKAAQAVSQLVQKGHDVQIAATPSALKFVGSSTWEGLTGKPILDDLFAEGRQMDHIHIARWADVLILCPASAHSISQWANGAAGDFPSTLFLAFERVKPVLLAPAMNKEMWGHPAVQTNLRRLGEWGVRVIEPEEGALACGETGSGRLASPERIVREIEMAISPAAKRGHVLVTAGGTREPIDGVRFITNFSTGRTGAVITDRLVDAGYDVVYLHGLDAQLPQRKAECVAFSDFLSLESSLRSLLRARGFHAVIHAAAVSDFSVADVESDGSKNGGKLSSGQNLTIRLSPNPKLVLNLKEWGGNPLVIAFKLTDTADAGQRAEAIEKLLSRAEVDAVVWNDLKSIGSDQHLGSIFTKNTAPVAFSTKSQLAGQLLELIAEVKR